MNLPFPPLEKLFYTTGQALLGKEGMVILPLLRGEKEGLLNVYITYNS
jgi:hypothetical protein